MQDSPLQALSPARAGVVPRPVQVLSPAPFTNAGLARAGVVPRPVQVLSPAPFTNAGLACAGIVPLACAGVVTCTVRTCRCCNMHASEKSAEATGGLKISIRRTFRRKLVA
ncbi:hypothetical protein EXU57_19490 [Segetibacter sp. 3557_3]|uniref:hypothetical protein n=1 Tax=Segetibacter sp. 3557_3 TaxID=2547429 RepID=UPI0010587044|nr:hypothetical protein [Segetibacter sp. 3557_3]TDH21385.1 hypothetical protein EXU57_19490 [Segetibacter sp. 3557_3]